MTSVPTPIPSRTQFVLEGIKHRILTGLLSPGQALVESELAAQFGVSKTPVREALKTLAGTGLVVMSQYKGVTVRRVDADMAREVYDVRLLLEPEALRRTVRRGESLAAAREALERADAATDTAERSLANRAFHQALYAPCGNPLLGRMLDEVRDQAALVSAVAWAAQPSWGREAAEHREILRLALAGDADGAAGALHAHIASFVARAYPHEAGSVDRAAGDVAAVAGAARTGTHTAGTHTAASGDATARRTTAADTTGTTGTTGTPGAPRRAGAAEGEAVL